MTDSKKPSKKIKKDLLEKKNSSVTSLKKETSLTAADPLKKYLLEVSRYPILTPEEELQAAEEYKKNQNKEAAQKLVLSNLRLVVKIAYEYRNAFMNMLDLIQEGNMGLMRAVQKYDLEKGVRFTSYAAWWVRAYILKFILDNFRLVKIGTTQAQKKLFFNLMKEKDRIEKLGFDATSRLLSSNLDVKESDVIQMQTRLGSREVELDAPRANFEGALNMDFIPIEGDDSEDQSEKNQLKEMLMNNLGDFTKSLNEKEKQIFSERIFVEVPKTLQEIADEYGITRERIRQIESRVITKMKKFFQEKGLR